MRVDNARTFYLSKEEAVFYPKSWNLRHRIEHLRPFLQPATCDLRKLPGLEASLGYHFYTEDW